MEEFLCQDHDILLEKMLYREVRVLLEKTINYKVISYLHRYAYFYYASNKSFFQRFASYVFL